MSIAEPKLLTVQQMAEQYNYPQSTIYQWVREKKIRAVRVGRSVRIPRDAAELFVQERVS